MIVRSPVVGMSRGRMGNGYVLVTIGGRFFGRSLLLGSMRPVVRRVRPP
jgi:hypothetical protein